MGYNKDKSILNEIIFIFCIGWGLKGLSIKPTVIAKIMENYRKT